jgi:NADH-quinone oxidoreductase subunit L
MNLVQLSGTLVSSEAATATGAASYAWLLVALPAFGAAFLLFGGRRTDKFGPLLATGLSWAGFVVAVAIWLQMLGRPGEERAWNLHLYSWVPAGSFHVDAGMLVDPLSMAFVLLVTFVGSLILVYSLGYMAHDPAKRRFFAYLNLFIASMLLLVLANSYLLLYVGWEGVGLASYLLIGFWYHNTDYATAGNKAFFANRVGDVGMSLAIMAMFFLFGRVDFAGVEAGVAQGGNQGWITFTGLMLLLAACGKSAQFPLQSWLGDAMAGPTPVSALIHAATMVTAGVYLVVRSHVIFEASPTAQLLVVIVGAITLLFGAVVGCAKDDLKKALAASTMSQIGYMMLAAGLGPVGYAFAIFHLLTHGFFKAGLFLGAGSVMHAMNDQIDMRRFGGLRAVMMITWVTFGLGWLAIIGFPGLSGFWSKDKIIESAFVGEGWHAWVFGLAALIGAGITAFYMTRLFFMTFHGKRRWTEDVHPHESPLTMTIPMMVLACGSAALGGILGPTGLITSWLEPVVGPAEGHGEPVMSAPLITGLTMLLLVIGGLLAWWRYLREPVPVVAPVGSLATRVARRDLLQDDVNDAALVRPGTQLTRALVSVDSRGIDGSVTGLADFVGGLSGRVRRLQNGFVRSYALTMLAGVVFILGALWVVQ